MVIKKRNLIILDKFKINYLDACFIFYFNLMKVKIEIFILIPK